ncbi:MAG TPA: TatD family hydrolase [Pseudonocardiaceae bacterium]
MARRKGERDQLPPAPEPLPAPVVDAHTHLDACGATDRDSVVAMVDRAAAVGVTRVVTVADSVDSARWAAEASTWDDRVFAAVALHPTRTANFSDADKQALLDLARQPRVVAVGETGLDYYWDYAPRQAQQDAFRWHIELAKRVGKPLMIHDRDAHEDVLAILKSEGPPETVILHCFSGDADFARRCLAEGFVLSFAGTVTFRNAPGVREAAALTPSDQLLVETDAPFLTPHPFRGRRNEPYCTAYTVRELAHLRQDDIVNLINSLRSNAERVFRLVQTG